MRPLHCPSRTTRRISLTPLIDIVFILLLFFILESNFLRFGELSFNQVREDHPGTSQTSALSLQVFDNGRIWLDGHALDLGELDSYLTDRHYQSKRPVFVEVQENLPVQLLVKVVDLLQHHSLSNLQLVPLED